MSPRRKKADDDIPRPKDRDYYRQRSQEARTHLAGQPAPVEWEKGGVIKRLNPNPGTMRRSEQRLLVFDLAVSKRQERTAKGEHESRFSKRPLRTRAAVRSRRRAAAKIARRRNRDR